VFKNVASQKLTVFAFDSTTNLPKSGDAANITAYVDKDDGGVTVLGDTSATEKDATNAKGYYIFDLTQAETNGDKLLFSAKSATANIVVVAVPAVVYTYPNRFSTLVIDAAGLADANAVKVGPSGSGTAQTARDIGASVLVGDKTGFSLSAGGIQAIWDALTSALTTVGSIGKRLVDNLTGDIYARLGAPAGASIAADLAEIEAETDDIAAIKAKTDNLPPSPAAVGSAMTLASGAITAAVVATDAIDADALAADAVAEIQSGLSTLNAAGVRSAVGLASANLDTQLDTLPTATENANAVLDVAASSHNTSGTIGEAINTAALLNTPDDSSGAGSKSNYLENLSLDSILGGPAFTRPSVVYVGLLTDSNTGAQRDAGDVTEVTSAGGYTRVAVTNNPANWPAASAGQKSNANAITFPTATASWGTVQAFGIWDAASSGNLLFWGNLSASQAISTGDTPNFGAGTIRIAES
jgi:hypothetical protein